MNITHYIASHGQWGCWRVRQQYNINTLLKGKLIPYMLLFHPLFYFTFILSMPVLFSYLLMKVRSLGVFAVVEDALRSSGININMSILCMS